MNCFIAHRRKEMTEYNWERTSEEIDTVELKKFGEDLLQKIDSCLDHVNSSEFFQIRDLSSENTLFEDRLFEINNHAFAAYRARDRDYDEESIFLVQHTSEDKDKLEEIEKISSKLLFQEKNAQPGCHESEGNPGFLYFRDYSEQGEKYQLLDPNLAIEKVVQVGMYAEETENFCEKSDYDNYLRKLAINNPNASLLNKMFYCAHEFQKLSLATLVGKLNELRLKVKEDLDNIERHQEWGIKQVFFLNTDQIRNEFAYELSKIINISQKTIAERILLLKDLCEYSCDLKDILSYRKLDWQLSFTTSRAESAMVLPDIIENLLRVIKVSEINNRIGHHRDVQWGLKDILHLLKSKVTKTDSTKMTLQRRLDALDKDFIKIKNVIENQYHYNLSTEMIDNIINRINKGAATIYSALDKSALIDSLSDQSQSSQKEITEKYASVIKLPKKRFSHKTNYECCINYLKNGNEKIEQSAFVIIDGKKCNYGKWWHNQRLNDNRKKSVEGYLNEICKLIPDNSDKEMIPRKSKKSEKHD